MHFYRERERDLDGGLSAQEELDCTTTSLWCSALWTRFGLGRDSRPGAYIYVLPFASAVFRICAICNRDHVLVRHRRQYVLAMAYTRSTLEEARSAASRIVKRCNLTGEIISRIHLVFKRGNPQRAVVDVDDVIRETIVLVSSEAIAVLCISSQIFRKSWQIASNCSRC
jgi:hypothetical protein